MFCVYFLYVQYFWIKSSFWHWMEYIQHSMERTQIFALELNIFRIFWSEFWNRAQVKNEKRQKKNDKQLERICAIYAQLILEQFKWWFIGKISSRIAFKCSPIQALKLLLMTIRAVKYAVINCILACWVLFFGHSCPSHFQNSSPIKITCNEW